MIDDICRNHEIEKGICRVRWVERLETDGDSCELIGLEVNPWIPEDRPKKITECLVEVLT
ncbi:hypothetical protein [Halalkalicoccus ordinarius]|uniref:hypothetical protein n=1 Tax=Halalkalicoccus ordinarius TaxID=3116651 RepID=UPI00300F0391